VKFDYRGGGLRKTECCSNQKQSRSRTNNEGGKPGNVGEEGKKARERQ